MFANPVHTHQGNRILTPAIVRALPIRLELGFEVVTFVSLVLFGFSLFQIMRAVELSTARASVGVLVVATLFYPVAYYSQNPYLIDPPFLLLWALCVLLCIQERMVLLAIVIVAAATAKEAIFFFAPACFYMWLERMTLVKCALRVVVVIPARGSHILVLHVLFSSVDLEKSVVGQTSSALSSFNRATMRGVASGFLLSGGALWTGALLKRHATRPGLRRLFLSGLWATIPVLVIATSLDTGRLLTAFTPFWIPFVIASWTRGDSVGSGVQQLTLVAVVMGNVLLALATLLNLSVVEEILLRVAGWGSIWSPSRSCRGSSAA